MRYQIFILLPCLVLPLTEQAVRPLKIGGRDA